MTKYYRLIPADVGAIHRFLPNSYYEPFDENGFMHQENDIFSQHLEVCFSPTIAQCIYALGFWLKDNIYYVYVTEKHPELNLNKKENPLDYQLSGEVRYRKPVEARLVGKVYINDNMQSEYKSLRNDMTNGLDDVGILTNRIQLLGHQIMNTYEKITRPIPATKEQECSFSVAEIINIVFSHPNRSFINEAEIIEIYHSPTGFDLLIEDSEGLFWINADDERIRKINTLIN